MPDCLGEWIVLRYACSAISLQQKGIAMPPAVMKKPKTGKAPKSAAAPKTAKVVSEVDLLIARLKRIRKGQQGTLDLREAIADGRD